MNKTNWERIFRRTTAAGLAGIMLWWGGAQARVDAAALKDVFDEYYYADTYKDLKEAYGYNREALWNHYVQYGLAEGRSMSSLINVVKYRQQYADLSAVFGDNWDAYINHYLAVGAKEGRDGGAGNEFDALDYAARYGDLQAIYGDNVFELWKHYQTVGAKEGRDARPEEAILAENGANRGETEEPEDPSKPDVTPEPEETPEPDVTPEPEETQKPQEARGIYVAYHTQEEIRERMKNDGISKSDAVAFAENPVTTAPYGAGSLSQETLESALKMLNQIRYIAGLSDNVALKDEYNRLTQAASLVNYANGSLSHFPEKPADMGDELYELGKNGAGSSNIAWASWSTSNLNFTIVDQWMADDDDSNIDRVGHRRWVLNPKMGATGFGLVNGSRGSYSAMYSFDGSASGGAYGVAWPAQNTPLAYFGNTYPWSVSMGYTVNQDTVKVTLTRISDGKVWNFSGESADGAFYVNNDGFGQIGCIIFRPADISYHAGDSFRVAIEGLNEPVSYTVNFFD